jgi:hypothetical protein
MDSCHLCKSVLKKGVVSCRLAAGMTGKNFWTVALCVKGGTNGGIYVIYTHFIHKIGYNNKYMQRKLLDKE